MSKHMPVVFVSHGAPDALLKAQDTMDCWRAIVRHIPEPTAILAISAHWEAARPTLSLAAAPETIHDFSGFAPALSRMQYHAPGAPALANQAAALLCAAGLAVDLHPSRGLDHGAWMPLTLFYPEANVPVTQLSLMRNASATSHFAIGQALAPLRAEGVLIIASGAITHNFDWLDWQPANSHVPVPEAQRFTDWVARQLATGDIAAMLDYRSAPHGAEAHPSEEHLLPLFVALGAAQGELPQRYRPHFSYAGLAMDAYVWGNPPTTALIEPDIAA